MKTLGHVIPRLLLLGALLVPAVAVNGSQLLTVAVSPAQSVEPSTVRVQIHVEPRDENRVLAVIADSGDYYRSSSIPLEGANAPATFHLSYPNLPGGDYVVQCVVIDSTGHQRAFAHANLSIQTIF